MQNTRLINEIANIGKNLASLANELITIAAKAPRSNHECVAADLCCALLNVERNTIALRNLVSRVAPKRTYPQRDTIVAAHDISITEETHWFKISMPAILPGVKRREAPSYLLGPLREALTSYVRAEELSPFTSCIMVVEHEYDATVGAPRYLDYDNVEIKGIIDVITSRLLTDDTSRLLHIHQAALTSDCDRTNVYVMNQHSFRHWVDKRYSARA